MTSPTHILNPAQVALFLDIDGTLLGIEERPEYVASTPELRELLKTASKALDGALALVSGRTLSDIDRIFDPLKLPAVGSHGAERRFSGGEIESITTQALPSAVVRRLRDLTATHPEMLLETKSTGVALHFRLAPSLANTAERAMRDALKVAGNSFDMLSGKMVFELVPRGIDKGSAILNFMNHSPYCGRQPIFVGDDVTDEAGFRVVNKLGGDSIRVGDSATTAASQAITDIAAVHRWLKRSFSINRA